MGIATTRLVASDNVGPLNHTRQLGGGYDGTCIFWPSSSTSPCSRGARIVPEFREQKPSERRVKMHIPRGESDEDVCD